MSYLDEIEAAKIKLTNRLEKADTEQWQNKKDKYLCLVNIYHVYAVELNKLITSKNLPRDILCWLQTQIEIAIQNSEQAAVQLRNEYKSCEVFPPLP